MMENRIRGELTVSEAQKEREQGRKVIVLRRRPADMAENDFQLEELGDYIPGCHFLVIEEAGGRPCPEPGPAEEPGRDTEPEVKDKPKPENPGKADPAPGKTPRRKGDIDVGKIKALHDAGRSQKWIADEMRISEATVSVKLKEIQGGKDVKGRMTYIEPDGTWGLNGIPWEEIDHRLHEALCKLKDYEKTGLSPDEVERLKDRFDELNEFEKTQCAQLLMELGRERERRQWNPLPGPLPEDPDPGTEAVGLPEYIVMISGAERPTVLWYEGEGRWYDNVSGEYYRVAAWMRMPEPYRPDN